MVRIPRLRLGGPPAQRDATVLLTVATFMITARVPMGFLALLALPAVVLLVQGLRRHPHVSRSLRRLLVTCLATSFVALAMTNPASLVSTSGGFMVVVAITLMAAAVFASGDRRRASDRVLDGLYGGLLAAWALSMFEAVTGIKFLPMLYPSANTVADVRLHRFYVTALYPNYNDYSVAMTMLALLVLSKLLFQPRRGAATAGRWLVLATATFFIVYMGSRGSLLALVLGAAALLAMTVRVVRPRAIGFRPVVLTVLLVLVGGVALVTSPYVADHSTATRGVIASNILAMLQADPVRLLIGYGSLGNYQAAASARYGSTLMDPHNLLLEYVVCYGVFALLAFLACWWRVTRLGVLGMRRNAGWRVIGPSVVVALYPVLGIVTSSTLRYHLVWLWLVVALANLFDARPRTSAPVSVPRAAPAGPPAV